MLRELLDGDADLPLRHVARTRLARILIYQGNAAGVIELLDGQESDAFAATWNELLGDAYAELGQVADARAAYQRVLLDPLAQATVDQQLVQWKVLDLPETDESASPAVDTTPGDAPAEEPAANDAVDQAGEESGE